MYKYIAQNKVRFPSNRGALTVEQLFDLPLTSPNGFDLNSVAKEINSHLKTAGEESFVEVATIDPERKRLEVSLEVIKDVIKTKQEEKAARQNLLEKAEKRRKILDIINAKKDEALSAASLEDLEKQLAELSV